MSKFSIACLLIFASAISIAIILSSCFWANEGVDQQGLSLLEGYNLTHPDLEVSLPSILQEISGLTDIDDHTVACVQDEIGTVFVYNISTEKIVRQFSFGGAGDYEGITRVANTLYVMRSDAKLYEINNYRDTNYVVNEYDIQIPILDNEGLAFDPVHNRLLIAGKSESTKEEHAGTRLVYSFDLNTKALSTKPVHVFREAQIKDFIRKNNLEGTLKGKNKKIHIHPSAISVHPITGDVYVLSSKGRTLYVFDQNSDLIALKVLDRKKFIQPEGITFVDNGDMFISNEGKKGRPTLMKFKYQGK